MRAHCAMLSDSLCLGLCSLFEQLREKGELLTRKYSIYMFRFDYLLFWRNGLFCKAVNRKGRISFNESNTNILPLPQLNLSISTSIICNWIGSALVCGVSRRVLSVSSSHVTVCVILSFSCRICCPTDTAKHRIYGPSLNAHHACAPWLPVQTLPPRWKSSSASLPSWPPCGRSSTI